MVKYKQMGSRADGEEMPLSRKKLPRRYGTRKVDAEAESCARLLFGKSDFEDEIRQTRRLIHDLLS